MLRHLEMFIINAQIQAQLSMQNKGQVKYIDHNFVQT